MGSSSANTITKAVVLLGEIKAVAEHFGESLGLCFAGVPIPVFCVVGASWTKERSYSSVVS